MPGKFDPDAVTIIGLKVIGGEEAGASALAPKVGPLGLGAKKIAQDIAKATLNYKGLHVTCKLIVQNRKAQIEVVPTAATLIMKALNEPVRDRKEKNIIHDGDLSLDSVYDVARQLRAKSMAREFAGTVKEILGTCFSIGCTVGGKAPRDLQAQITSGELVVPDE